MEYLKEDGSLDVERIKKLPLEEYKQVIGNFTQKQYREYASATSQPLKEGQESIRTVKVNYTIEDLLKKGCVKADDFLNNLLEKDSV